MPEQSLHSMIPQEWIEDEAISEVLIRAYNSSLPLSESRIQSGILTQKTFKPLLKAKTLFGFFKTDVPNEIEQSNAEIRFLTDDTFNIQGSLDKKIIHPGAYLLLFAPLRSEGGTTHEGEANEALDECRGMLTTIFGHTAAHSLAFEVRLDPSQEDKITFTSPAFEAHTWPSQWEVFEHKSLIALGKALEEADPDLKRRAATALRFIGRSTNDLDRVIRFSHAWIALECVAGGSKEASLWLTSLHPEIDLAIKRLKNMRNFLFHDGISPDFTPDDERFVLSCVIGLLMSYFGISDEGFQKLVTHQTAAI